jgi:hypothetical protein
MFMLFLLMVYDEEKKKIENKNNQRTNGCGGYKAAFSAKGKRCRNQRIPRLSLLMP